MVLYWRLQIAAWVVLYWRLLIAAWVVLYWRLQIELPAASCFFAQQQAKQRWPTLALGSSRF